VDIGANGVGVAAQQSCNLPDWLALRGKLHRLETKVDPRLGGRFDPLEEFLFLLRSQRASKQHLSLLQKGEKTKETPFPEEKDNNKKRK